MTDNGASKNGGAPAPAPSPSANANGASTNGGARVLLTGATGFLGKVVLAELMRQREALNIDRVRLLIRRKRGQSPEARFMSEIAASPAMAALSEDWAQRIDVEGCELSRDGCDLEDDARERIRAETTHVIHCAASVEFDLPIARAAAANITSSLNMVELIAPAAQLESLCMVSTAYVTAHQAGRGVQTVDEVLAPLPFEPRAVYDEILADKADEDALKERAGLPNTYTLTKCVAEHLVAEAARELPLVIVRPSIISAAWQHPVPGWIDSYAAFAAFVTMIGSGHFRTLLARPETGLDIVPVDEVSARIIEATFSGIATTGTPAIRHAASGLARTSRVDVCCQEIAAYFRRDPLDRLPKVNHVGTEGLRFKLAEMRHHKLPVKVRTTWAKLRKDKQVKKTVRLMSSRMAYLNRAFPYFTHHTFDFKTAFAPLEDGSPGGAEYIKVVCRGAHEHLLGGELETTSLIGKTHSRKRSDIAWAFGQPRGNPLVRLTGLVLAKAFRRCIEQVTFDRPSFEAARAAVPEDSFFVIVPSHRSYLDFLLLSFLFFDRPDLDIAIPRIAAADEFRKIPILGAIFRRCGAFYIRRGTGGPDPQLTEQVQGLVQDRQTLQFFIEGTRSRTRQFLPPKRGLLRCLQETGQRCTLLPVTLSYDRLPEEGPFLGELAGGDKPPMSLRGLLRWSWQLARGKVQLGRVHIRAGQPQVMDEGTNIHELSREIVGQLQQQLVSTTHHLRCFLHQNPIEGVDADWLADQIVARGGQVIDSPLENEAEVDPLIERTLRYQWKHHFYRDALQRWPEHPVISQYIEDTGYATPRAHDHLPASVLDDPRVDRLLRALFAPIVEEYAEVGRALLELRAGGEPPTGQALRRLVPTVHPPTMASALDDLVAREIVATGETRGVWTFGERIDDLDDWIAACAWPGDAPRQAPAPAESVPAEVS